MGSATRVDDPREGDRGRKIVDVKKKVAGSGVCTDRDGILSHRTCVTGEVGRYERLRLREVRSIQMGANRMSGRRQLRELFVALGEVVVLAAVNTSVCKWYFWTWEEA